MFDHWAHLGGAAFGAFYFAYGPQFWAWLRAVNGGAMDKPSELTSLFPTSTSNDLATDIVV